MGLPFPSAASLLTWACLYDSITLGHPFVLTTSRLELTQAAPLPDNRKLGAENASLGAVLGYYRCHGHRAIEVSTVVVGRSTDRS